MRTTIATLCLLVVVVVAVVHAAKPTIKLTFTPNEKYIARDQQIEIRCELLNGNERSELPQLWYIDLKNGKRTPISRTLLTTPTDDAPHVFKSNKNHRYEFVQKNWIRIRRLQMEDSAKYECDCPDCEESISKSARDLQVMKLTEPKWLIEPGLPIHENTQTTIKCIAEDFYPYVNHKILRHNHDITNEGKSNVSNPQLFPQKLTWEKTFTPTADWHNTTLRCAVTQGNTEQTTSKTLDVLFLPRFGVCNEQQQVDPKREFSTIECSYSGNPAPKLHWLRQTDQRPITSDAGVTVETKEESNGKYKSIVTFDRSKLISVPSPSTTAAATTNNGQGDQSLADAYYQQLLQAGFLVRLTVNNIEKGTRVIQIVRDANQIRSTGLNSSIRLSISSALVAVLCLLPRLL